MGDRDFTIDVDATHRVSGLCSGPENAALVLVLGHGAGAGMRHASMEGVAQGLGERGIAVLRYQFPYMEQGGRRPDPPPLCHATVRAAVAAAGARWPDASVFAGGRSFGGRMTSQAQAVTPLAGVRGLVFFAFPLHLAGKPDTARAAHLSKIEVPMLFLQGTRDALADLDLLRSVTAGLGARATLEVIEDADHSFHVRQKSGRNDDQARDAMLDSAAAWMRGHAPATRRMASASERAPRA